MYYPKYFKLLTKIKYIELTPWKKVLHEKVTVIQLVMKFLTFMQPKCPLSSSQEPTTISYLEWDESSPHTCNLNDFSFWDCSEIYISYTYLYNKEVNWIHSHGLQLLYEITHMMEDRSLVIYEIKELYCSTYPTPTDL